MYKTKTMTTPKGDKYCLYGVAKDKTTADLVENACKKTGAKVLRDFIPSKDEHLVWVNEEWMDKQS